MGFDLVSARFVAGASLQGTGLSVQTYLEESSSLRCKGFALLARGGSFEGQVIQRMSDPWAQRSGTGPLAWPVLSFIANVFQGLAM